MPPNEEPVELSDEELIRLADEEIEAECLLVAARLLERVENQDLLTAEHQEALTKAKIIQGIIDVHMVSAEEDPGWKKQGESHGNRDTIIYYKVEDHSKLICRIETPIEASLLVPLLAVVNESDLYEKWMPKWRFPRLGVRQSKMLKDYPSRGAQVIQVTLDMPYPISTREVVFKTFAVDAIEELSLISMTGRSLQVGADDGLVPPPEEGIKRIDFDSGWVVRQCPEDHPCLRNSKHKYPQDEHLLLVTLTMFADAHVGWVPQSVINFSTRTALSGLWGSLLQVATDVKEGKRPDHAKCIDEKKELYGWVNERIEAMYAKIDQDNQKVEG
jgi:hypothetical protein